MAAEKREWDKPELVVLVRSRPEEAVLTNCKYPSANGGPQRNNCKAPTTGADCSSPVGS